MAKPKELKPKIKKQEILEKPRTIYDALFAFQGESIVIPRNGRGKSSSGQSYKYATLDDVITMTREALQKHKLMYTQIIFQKDSGETFLKTTLVCVNADRAPYEKSPEVIETIIPLGNAKSAQDMGSRITYMRRYALVPILGLSIEDDLDSVTPDLIPETPKTEPVAHRVGNQPVETVPSQPNASVVSELKETPDAPPKEFTFTSPKAEEKLAATVNTMVQKPVVRSKFHQRAFDLINASLDEAQLERVTNQVKISVNLNAAEKADLQEVIKLKETEISYTVHI